MHDDDRRVRRQIGRILHPDEIATAVGGSLRRLGVDATDLYYQHRVNPDYPIKDSTYAARDLIAAGKVKNQSMSEATIRSCRATRHGRPERVFALMASA